MDLPVLSSDVVSFLTPQQMDLFKEGYHLYNHVQEHRDQFVDYSFVVFPFAKAFEGFLKKIFVETHLITKSDYESRHFRVGEVMSPHLAARLRDRSVYKKLCGQVGCELGDSIWETWKQGRNEVFHYFPDSSQVLDLDDVTKRILLILKTVEDTYRLLK